MDSHRQTTHPLKASMVPAPPPRAPRRPMSPLEPNYRYNLILPRREQARASAAGTPTIQ